MQIFGYGWPSAEKIFGEGGADGRPPQRLRPEHPTPNKGATTEGTNGRSAGPKHGMNGAPVQLGTIQGGMGPLCAGPSTRARTRERGRTRHTGGAQAIREADRPDPQPCIKEGGRSVA